MLKKRLRTSAVSDGEPPMMPLVTPHGAVIVMLTLSAGAWLFPSFGILQKGFAEAERITAFAVFYVSAWYMMIVGASVLGFRIGDRAGSRFKLPEGIVSLEDDGFFAALSATAAAGVLFAFWRIIGVLGIEGVLASLGATQGNDLREALLEGYTAGLGSLRYVIALSGGLSIFRLLVRRRITVLDIVNIVLLLLAGLVASRLLIVAAIVVALCIYGRDDTWRSRRTVYASLIGVFVIFGLLSVYNYFRNFGYYENIGVSDFWAAGLSSMLTYLATPFQVSLGIANHLGRALEDATGALYFRDFDVAADRWSLYTDIDPNLTTNAALSELHLNGGVWAFPLMAAVTLVLAYLLGFLQRNRRSGFFLAYPAIMYGFFEIWRLMLFYRGVWQTLVLVGFAMPFAFLIATRLIHPRIDESAGNSVS